jgi:hypothetical protein
LGAPASCWHEKKETAVQRRTTMEANKQLIEDFYKAFQVMD